MSFAGGRVRAACFAAALALTAGQVSADDTQAHMLAEKFAGDGAQKSAEVHSPEDARRAEEARKKEAEEMALEALRETARKQAEAALKADREKLKAQGKIIAPKAPVKPADDGKSEENEMLARARREEESRKSGEQQARAEAEARRAIEEADDARRQIEAILAATEAPPVNKPAANKPQAEPPSANEAPDTVVTAPASNPEADAAAAAQARQKVVADVRRVWRLSTDRIAAQDRADEDAKALAEAESAHRKVVADARRTWRQSADRVAEGARAEAEEKARVAAEDAHLKVIADARRMWRQSADRIAASARVEAEEKARLAAAAPAAPAPTTPDTVANSAPAAAPPAVAAVSALPEAPTRTPETAAQRPQSLESRITILIVMTPGNKGIRRHNKQADPVLCLNDGCFISAGPGTPAHFLPTHKVLGFGNTWGERAGACRNQLGCVFRALPVAELPLIVQPVDMRVIKHDRRRTQAVEVDSQCRMDGQRLSCAHGIYADDYVMWVVPESLAASAGAAALEKAVQDGLNGPRSAGLAAGRL